MALIFLAFIEHTFSNICSHYAERVSISSTAWKFPHRKFVYLLIGTQPRISLVTYIHTYIIGYYNPSVRIIDLVSHTTYVVKNVNFINKQRELQFKVDCELQIFFEKLFMASLFTVTSFCQKSAERKSPKKYFFFFSYFALMLAW